LIRVVVDTNIFISSFFGGNPRKIIDLWKSGQIILCLSRLIIDEYINVLRRMGLQDERELEEILSVFAHGYHVLFTSKSPNLNIVEKDPDDNKFIECAVALNAKSIITGDKALQEIKNYMGIKIQSPKQFIDDYIKKKR
jgi:putative PIN family toxin of toxin-antitoxin system